jgi:hypothetical protein
MSTVLVRNRAGDRLGHTALRLWMAVVLAAATVLVALVAAPPPASAAYCGLTWGSLSKASSRMVTGPITNVRAGRHTCYDRLVVDLGKHRTGYLVRYVTNVHEEGSGAVIPLRGGAKLEIIVRAPAYDTNGNGTYHPANSDELRNVTGYRTFRQIAWGGSFEGQSTIGLGVRAKLPFRVFTIDDGATSRMVVDVAHKW